MHSFRLHARLAKNWRFESPTLTFNLTGLDPITISHSDSKYTLDNEKLWQRSDIDTVCVEFTSFNYTSLEKAQAAVTQLRHVLATFGASRGAAIDPGFVSMLFDLKSDFPSYHGVDFSEDNRFIKNVHYSGGGQTIRVTGNNDFQNQLESLMPQSLLSPERVRALAVLANNEFPGGLRGMLDDGLGTLVARVSAIEAMVKCQDVSDNLKRCINELLEVSDNNKTLSSGEHEFIRNGLLRLKKESISQSCRNLISESIDPKEFPKPAEEVEDLVKSPLQQFNRAYAHRSSFLHDGVFPDMKVTTLQKYDLLRQVGIDLWEIINRLVIAPKKGINKN